MDFTICKLGRVILREEINKGNSTYLTYAVSGQPMFDSYQKETMINPSQRYNYLMMIQGNRRGKHLNLPFLLQSWTNQCGNGFDFLNIVTEHDVHTCLTNSFDGPTFNHISSRSFQSAKYHKVIRDFEANVP